jgi:peptidoglycan/LPS O-acetylase OafA/YrhL
MLLGLRRRIGEKTALCMAAGVFLAGPALVRGFALPVNSAPHSVVTAVDQICIGVVMAWISLAAPTRFAALARGLPAGVALCTLFWFEQRWIAAPLRQALWTDVLATGIALCLPAASCWRAASGFMAIAVRAISLRSYGLYIVHLPVLELASFYRQGLHAPIWCAVAAASVVIVILPVLSWRYLERPLLRKGAGDGSMHLSTVGNDVPSPQTPSRS